MNPLPAMDDQAAERFALILDSLWTEGNPIPTNDLWIAATAGFVFRPSMVTSITHRTPSGSYPASLNVSE